MHEPLFSSSFPCYHCHSGLKYEKKFNLGIFVSMFFLSKAIIKKDIIIYRNFCFIAFLAHCAHLSPKATQFFFQSFCIIVGAQVFVGPSLRFETCGRATIDLNNNFSCSKMAFSKVLAAS